MTSRTVLQGFPILAKSLSAGTPSLIPRLSCWWCLMPPRMSGEPTSEVHSQTHLRWVHRNVTGKGYASQPVLACQLSQHSTCSASLPACRFMNNPFVTGPPFVRFYAGCPLVMSSGYRLGAL